MMYAASDVLTCLAEVFQEDRVIDVSWSEPWLAAIAVERELRLLNLAGSWPTAAGASMAIGSGSRALTQEWSPAIYEAFPDIDGLWYASSMNANQPSIALYERSEDALPESPVFHRPLADPSLISTLRGAAGRFGYGIV